MKALVLTDYKCLEYKDVPDPEIKPDEVLLRVKACAICGSDIHGYDGGSGRRIPPVIMGHEAAGVIEKAGVGVKGFCEGDRVTFDSTMYCRDCVPCKEGRINLCDNRRVFGVSCGDYAKDGAMAEYLAVPEYVLYRLPDSVSFEAASVIEPLAIALHAVNRTHLREGDNVLVAGCGTIGQFITRILGSLYSCHVTALDIDNEKLEMALDNGADSIVNTKEDDVGARVFELTGGEGMDAAIEAVGISATVGYAIDSLKKGGELTLVGNIQQNIDFPLQRVVTNEIRINSSCASAGEYAACLELIEAGKIDLDGIIGKAVPLSEGADWFERLYQGLPGIVKVVLLP
ncbi:MAG: galactitol-1-phosphate 5-dehydrogenase [Clostridiales bacterium]|nr:galactitol-1-phosphate 5-dehydrogenase [Clostridiales bacterium]